MSYLTRITPPLIHTTERRLLLGWDGMEWNDCWVSKQKFDVDHQAQEKLQQHSCEVYQSAASMSANVPPRAKMYEGLVPVSLDAVPLRQRRTGKQVGNPYTSRERKTMNLEDSPNFKEVGIQVNLVKNWKCNWIFFL